MLKAIAITFLLVFFPALACSFSNIPSNQFIYKIKNENDFVHVRITGELVDKSLFYAAIKNAEMHKFIKVDAAVLQKASGVLRADAVWNFSNNQFNSQISNLFKKISDSEKELGFSVKLSNYDLFHGHLFAVYAPDGSIDDVGILFHAKEYPRDLPLGNPDAEKNSPFTTNSLGYHYRNFIWLASTGLIYNINSHSADIFPTYFLPKNWDITNSSLHDITLMYLQAKTFTLDNLIPYVELLGDVNYFVIDDKSILFFTY